MKINSQINTEAAEKVNWIRPKKEKLLRLERDIKTQPGTFDNHLKAGGMVNDNIHILLSVNSIIISVILALVVKNLDQATYLILPTVFLLSIFLITIYFLGKVLATKTRYLNIGYKVFILGLIASLFALGLSFFWT